MNKVIEGEKHITASVWLLSNETPHKILMIYHKKLDTWFQPGGHVELKENPIEAAVREVREETGIDIAFLIQQIEQIDETGSLMPLPTFFMEQRIPAKGDDPEHFHLDLIYKVVVPSQKLVLNTLEAKQIGWFSLEEALALPLYKNTRVMVERLFDPQISNSNT